MLHNTVNVVRDLSLHTILAKSIPVTETEIILISSGNVLLSWEVYILRYLNLAKKIAKILRNFDLVHGSLRNWVNKQ